MPDTLHDDIRAAISSSAESQQQLPLGDGGGPSDDFSGPPASEVLPPVMPDDKNAPLQRGPDGKFLPRGAEPPEPVPAAPKGPVPPPPPVPPGAPQPLGTQTELKFDPNKPPDSWRPDMKGKWNKIPQDIREEITRREEATAVGVQKLQQYYEPMEEIYKSILPFEAYFEHIKEDPRAYLSSMIQVEQTMRLGNPAQKMTMVISLAEQYGVPIRNILNSAMDGKLDEMLMQAHQHHGTPTPIPPQVQQELTQLQQWKDSIEEQAADNELIQFAADPAHQYLDYVRDDMADLIEYGYAQTYQDAYDLAIWRNPQLRPYLIQQYAGNPQPGGQLAQRQAAARSVVPPGSAPLLTGAEEIDDNDDIHDAVRKAWNQNSGRA